METKIFEIKLKGFSFPKSLKDKHANFRFLVDLRFIDGKGEPKVVHAVLPSLASFWECDTDESKKLNFVRKKNPGFERRPSDDEYLPQFAMGRIADWDEMIFWVRGQSLKTIRFRVFDVNRENWWNKFTNVMKAIPGAFKTALGPALGVVEGVSSVLIEKMVSKDNLLFHGTKDLQPDQETGCVCGLGVPKQEYYSKDGPSNDAPRKYAIKFSIQ